MTKDQQNRQQTTTTESLSYQQGLMVTKEKGRKMLLRGRSAVANAHYYYFYENLEAKARHTEIPRQTSSPMFQEKRKRDLQDFLGAAPNVSDIAGASAPTDGTEVEGYGSMPDHIEPTVEGSGVLWHNETSAPSTSSQSLAEAINNLNPTGVMIPEEESSVVDSLTNTTYSTSASPSTDLGAGAETALPPTVTIPADNNLETAAPTLHGSKINGTDDEMLIEEDTSPAIPEPPNHHHEEEHATNSPEPSSQPTKPAWDPYTPYPVISTATPAPTPFLPPTHQQYNEQSSSPSQQQQGGLLGLLNTHPLFYVFIIMILSLFCCVRYKGRRQQRDSRGEYRAVGRMLASNFDTDVSDDEINGFSSDEDDDDPGYNGDGWHNHTKGTIEMRNIGHDGKLDLDEMNG